ncbi:MAG: 16S rRNA (cytosine(1402)-N(4))-methyltransferase RsmH [Synergistaceae bacterium]|nr:16S rRNA (cytosine(1402)-N(4))-methyltransferase RsmH [Synergistaceae bacterium]
MIEHTPVLLEEVVSQLAREGIPSFVVDATVGLGGYSERFLIEWPSCRVLGIDQDPMALERTVVRLSKPIEEGRFRVCAGNFRQLGQFVKESGWGMPDGIVFDLGVSNLQLSLSERGFSFQEDGPLDMRMGAGEKTAGDLLKDLSEAELRRLFRDYGEEPHSAAIARGIVKHREQKGPIMTTGELVNVIRTVLPAPLQRKMNRHPARRIFQALRIAVNDEMEALREGLDQAIRSVSGNGCVLVVSYHSLEDRIVKHAFNQWETEGLGRRMPRKAIQASPEEIQKNYKSRSAMLRVFRMSGSKIGPGR